MTEETGYRVFPQAEKVNLNMGGDTRSDDDKICARARRLLIERGLLIPSQERWGWGERPYMTRAVVQAYRKKLIKLEILTPEYM